MAAPSCAGVIAVGARRPQLSAAAAARVPLLRSEQRRLSPAGATPSSSAPTPAPAAGAPFAAPLHLGRLTLSSGVILSPMEAVSDTWTEMIRAAALARNNASTLELVDTWDATTPTGVQLMAKSVEELRGAFARLEAGAALGGDRPQWRNIVAVDLNLGCPSPDVIRIGAGPALLKRRGRLRELFAAMAEWRDSTTLPRVGAVGCKIRLGLNALEQEARVYLPLVEAASEAGLDYVVVHARHAKQRSRDPPTWEAIAEIKAATSLPVIGNGDVASAADAARLRAMTGCDGVMIARAAIRNPWMLGALAGRTAADDEPRPTVDEVDAAAEAYAAMADAHSTRAKYREFNAANFARLRLAAATGDWSASWRPPATAHLS